MIRITIIGVTLSRADKLVSKGWFKNTIFGCVLFFCIFFTQCKSISQWMRSNGKVEGILINSESKSIIGIGLIENRDYKLGIHFIKNFQDMLQYEFLNKGYTLVELKKNQIEEEIFLDKKIIEPNLAMNSTSLTAELLPSRFKMIAGENRTPEKQVKIQESHISKDQIEKLADRYKFNYFIQGSIGNNESGVLLDSETSSIIFLRIYDKKGTLVGIVSFTATGRSLMETSFLKSVCERMIEKFTIEIDKDKI